MEGRTIFRFFKRIVRNIMEFFYCNRDKVQEGVEKMLNVWIYEMIAIAGLTAGCLGLGFGKSDWSRAGLLWVGPLIFTFVLNVFTNWNWLAMMKRENSDPLVVNFPPQVRQLLTINMLIGFFIPFGIFAKTLFYKHFYALYKEDQLYWASPKDSRAERRKRYKAYRAMKRKEVDALL